MVTAAVLNTLVAARKETAESVDRCAALVRACARSTSGADEETKALAFTALGNAEEAADQLLAIYNHLGIAV